jgi:hypothetical protein
MIEGAPPVGLLWKQPRGGRALNPILALVDETSVIGS